MSAFEELIAKLQSILKIEELPEDVINNLRSEYYNVTASKLTDTVEFNEFVLWLQIFYIKIHF